MDYLLGHTPRKHDLQNHGVCARVTGAGGSSGSAGAAGGLPMNKITHISFCMSDQEFTKYTTMEWHNFVADCRELVHPDFKDVDIDDLIGLSHGDEFFWTEV